ncbi:hypothetical protein IU421_30010 [Nocardia cyriacigeorgica]|uniref:hypothetical protein n=1 Tax=Nocardia cyriacigeorgica TaxID=135487 RepID=UPI0018939ACC|nr:hypothetical protein [Nocardia cyriacigeorgica]MBF6518481.1 hypothetical protein [Nocardia cyriacigeorgica]
MMHPDVHYTCYVPGCAYTATEPHTFEFAGRTVHRPMCLDHYVHHLHTEWVLDHYDGAHG